MKVRDSGRIACAVQPDGGWTMKCRVAVVLGTLLVTALATNAAGQGFQGGLRGAVKDPNGVIPGVEVTLTNEATSIKRSVVSNDAGEYVFASVEPGTYTVRAALQGFKTVERRSVRIGTQQFLVLDLTLDGVPITDMRNRASANPTIEAVDDLKVQVHTYDAEMARTGGGTFNVTAKSGTNLMHGTAFFQTRPIWAEQNNYFADIAKAVAS